jgi:hypothetical protein
METWHRDSMRRRFASRVIIAALIVLLVLLLGACGSAMYVKGVWERAFHECERHAPTSATGWKIAFHGDDDVFVCQYRPEGVPAAQLRPEEFMGDSGSWPVFPDLVAYELEKIDGDQP